LTLAAAGRATAFDPKNIELKDPSGDDKGPGTYKYPTKSDYKRGSFDIRGTAAPGVATASLCR
jgi:carbohydrate-binding DOMON domain-containing protein